MEGESLLDRTRMTAYGLQFAGLGATAGPTEMQLQDLSPRRWVECPIMHANMVVNEDYCSNGIRMKRTHSTSNTPHDHRDVKHCKVKVSV